jgi:hypothetical protein
MFGEFERAQDQAALVDLYLALRAAAMVDSPRVTEALLADDVFPGLAGALEYEPNLAVRPEYRKFLSERARFKQVVAIADPWVGCWRSGLGWGLTCYVRGGDRCCR